MILNSYDFKTLIKDKMAFEQLQKFKLPTKEKEEFRHFELEDIFTQNFDEENNLNSITTLPNQFHQDFYVLMVINGKVDLSQSKITPYIKLKESSKKNFTSFNSLFYLSETFIEKETILSIEKSLDRPLLIVSHNTYSNHFIPSSMTIEIAKNVEVDIIDLFIDKNNTNSYTNCNRFFYLKNSANVQYVKFQDLHQSSNLIINYRANIAKNATLESVTLDYQAHKSLNIWDVNLKHPKSTLHLYGLIKTKKTSHCGNISTIIHNATETSSNQEFKHILNDQAHALFDIKSIIEKNASFSKVLQNSQTILLSDDAKINAQPRLQIYTDELQASHGATTGALDEEQLNYLQLRGISQEKATTILLEAFEDKILSKIKNSLILNFVKNCTQGVGHV